jgi:hypothetical protein
MLRLLPLLVCGCTVLGPMPAMTGVPMTPSERPGVELQAAALPGYYLSTTVQERPEADQVPQLLALLEPDDLIGVPGVFAGARYAGESSSGGALEPLLGYRTPLDDDKRFSLAAVGFFSYASQEVNEASFSAWRGGVDAGVDARVTGVSSYAELHGNLGLVLTGLDASGRYCVDSERQYGIDCPDAPNQPLTRAAVSGLFPSGHVGASLELARHLQSAFHGVRLGVDLAGGLLPTVVAGDQRGMKLYGAAGLSLTVGVGASD